MQVDVQRAARSIVAMAAGVSLGLILATAAFELAAVVSVVAAIAVALPVGVILLGLIWRKTGSLSGPIVLGLVVGASTASVVLAWFATRPAFT